MTDTRPPIVSGPEPDPAEWLTAKKAAEATADLLPIQRPLHRSAIHRWAAAGKVEGRYCGGHLYVSRASLEAYCAPRSARVAGASRPSDSRQAEAAVKRMSRRHGVRTPKGGGTR